MPGTRKLGKTTDQRRAMLRQQVTDFLDNGKMESTVTRCKEIRPLAEKMITNTYLAEQLGVSKMTISRWCTNTTQPSAPQLIEISQVLQCDLKDLYETEK